MQLVYDKLQRHVLMIIISGSDTVPADMESVISVESCVSKLSLVYRIT